MNKVKTKKSILKRFKITSKKRFLRGQQYSRHRRSHKDKRRIRRFAEPKQVTKSQAKIIRSALGI